MIIIRASLRLVPHVPTFKSKRLVLSFLSPMPVGEIRIPVFVTERSEQMECPLFLPSLLHSKGFSVHWPLFL